MLLELTKRGQEPLGALLQFGVTFLEDHAAEYIIQQGGWGTVFNLESEDECPAGAAEDSNDIYILPSDGSTHVSPPESPTTATASWQAESLPVSLSASQSWHTESLPVSLGPESWQQVTVDPEEVKSLDSNGAAEKSENNSSNSDIVHVEREEIPEGVGEAAAPAPALMAAVPRASPTTSLFVELGEEEAEAAPPEASELEREGVLPPKPPAEPPAAPPSREEATGRQGALRVGPRPGDLEKAGPLPEGKSLLLLGGAAAMAILAVAVGLALALRKK
ncbi:bcl-2-like protein 13 isoform X2 [Cervus canadensis]|nr:bcl-2-like protein 13 isoform X2 [Cervus canadensis]